jgi:hypothetical protein
LLRIAVLAVVLLAPSLAHADPPKVRPFHWSIGGGGSFLLNGTHGGPRNRLDGAVTIEPGGRFGRWGLTFALRHVTPKPFADDGLATAGITYEPAAARPRLALALHADAGVTITDPSPVIGGGLQTHLWIWPRRLGPLAIVFDLTAHLVLSNVNDTRLVVGSATRLAIAF